MSFYNTKELTAQEKVTAEWNAMAGEWDDLAAGYAREFHRLLVAKAPFLNLDDNNNENANATTRLVDFGCGTGLLTDLVRGSCHKILAIDASPQMMEVLEDKIRSREWANVQAECVVLSKLNNNQADNSAARQVIEEWTESADVIVASSVLNFVPASDLLDTMSVLGRLLKPGGLFVHSDWLQTEAYPAGLTKDRAKEIYKMAGLELASIQVHNFRVGRGEALFGVAKKIA